MRPLVLFLLLIAGNALQAQVIPDSVISKTKDVTGRFSAVDSLPKLQVPDSLKTSFLKADTIRLQFIEETSKIKSSYDSTMSAYHKTTSKFNAKVDSLENLKLPTNKITSQLDSIRTHQEQATRKFSEKTSAVKAKTTDKLKQLDLPPQYGEPIQKLTSQVDGFSIEGAATDIPELNLPGYDLPKIEGGLSGLSMKEGLPDLSLPQVDTPLGDLNSVGDQVKGLQGDIQKIAEGNINDVQQLPKTIEQQAGKIDGMDQLQKQTGAMGEFQQSAADMNDPDAAKKQATDMAKKVAIDHFAGKEEQLKKAMDEMAKYKQKYSSVSSIKDLPKRKPNAMKGKPFIERFIPGLYFQFQQNNYNLFDFNPYAGYRISGLFTGGIGWNQRLAYDSRKNGWNHQSRIFGPRTFLDTKIGRGFVAHLELECMNTFVPFRLVNNPDEGKREWVWSFMTGLKKEYKIYKGLNGTVLIQYNIFNPKYKSPYADRLNSRIGFEYKFTKRKKK